MQAFSSDKTPSPQEGATYGTRQFPKPNKPLPPVPSSTSQIATGTLGGTATTPSAPQANVGSEHLGANNFTRFLPSRESISNMIHSAWEAVTNKASSIKQSVTKENIQKAGVIVWNVIKRAPSEIATGSVKQGREMKEELQENLKEMKDFGIKGYKASVEKTKAGYEAIVKVIGKAKRAASEAFSKLRESINEYKTKRQEQRQSLIEIEPKSTPKTSKPDQSTMPDDSGFSEITQEEAEALMGRSMEETEAKTPPPVPQKPNQERLAEMNRNLNAWRNGEVASETVDPFPSSPREPKGKERDTLFASSQFEGFKESDVPEEAFDLPEPPNIPLPQPPTAGSAKASGDESKTKWNRGLLNGLAAAIFRHPVQSIVKPLANRVKSNPEEAHLKTEEGSKAALSEKDKSLLIKKNYEDNLVRLGEYGAASQEVKKLGDQYSMVLKKDGTIVVKKTKNPKQLKSANAELADLIRTTASLGAELGYKSTNIFVPGTARPGSPGTELNIAGFIGRLETMKQVAEGTKLNQSFASFQTNAGPAYASIMATRKVFDFFESPKTKEVFLNLHKSVHGDKEVSYEIQEGRGNYTTFSDLIGDPGKPGSGSIVRDATRIQNESEVFLADPESSILEYLNGRLPLVRNELLKREGIIQKEYGSLEAARKALNGPLQKEYDDLKAELNFDKIKNEEAQLSKEVSDLKAAHGDKDARVLDAQKKLSDKKAELSFVTTELSKTKYSELSGELDYIDTRSEYVKKYEKWVTGKSKVDFTDKIFEEYSKAGSTGYNDALNALISSGVAEDFKAYCKLNYPEYPTFHFYAGQSPLTEEQELQNLDTIKHLGSEYYDLRQKILESVHLSRLQEGEAEGKGGIDNLFNLPVLIQKFMSDYPPRV